MRCNPLRWLLLGLLLVPVMTYLAVQFRHLHIEDDLKQRTEQALKNEGLAWAGSAFIGRDGLISGKAIEEDERSRAAQIVSSVWGVYQLENGTNLIDKEDNYVWYAKRRKNELRLTGFVPNKATRQSVLGLAKANFPELEIDDRMRYARGVPSRDIWMGGVSFGLKQLAMLRKGQVVLSGLDLSVSGPARNFAAYKTVKSALANRLPKGVTLKREQVTAPSVSPYSWSAKRKGNQLVLSGYVPNKTARDEIFGLSKIWFPKLTIVDRMQTALGQPGRWLAAVRIGLRQLAKLNGGSVLLADKAMKFSGVAATEPLASQIDAALRSGMPKNYRSRRNISFIKPAIKTVRPFTTSAAVSGDEIVLSGYVPGKDGLKALVAAAKSRFPKHRVIDNTEIAAGAPKDWQKCALVGIGALGRLGNGRLSMSHRTLVVTGSTRDEGLANSLAGEVRAATTRKCNSDVRIDYKALPEPNLVWTANWDGDQLLLAGDVPDAGTKTKLLSDAANLFPKAQVIDRMTVVGGRSKKWRRVATSGLSMLGKLRSGRARMEAQRLTVRGVASDSSTASAIRTRLARDLPGGYDGRESLTVRSDAMIWAQKDAKRKAERARVLEAERLRKSRQEAARKQAKEERIAAENAWRKAREETRLRILAEKRLAEQQARKRALEAERMQAANAARERAAAAAKERTAAAERTRMAHTAAAAAAALAAEQQQEQLAMARLEQQRVSCETNIRDVVKSGTIRFRKSRASLNRASFPTLDKIAAATGNCPLMQLEISGHTDSDGGAAGNKRLSEQRARAVLNYLVKAGMSKNRLTAIGYGESQPMVPNTSSQNKARNRRIEFNVKSN